MVTSLGKAALTLSTGKRVRGVPGNGGVLVCFERSIGGWFILVEFVELSMLVVERVAKDDDVGR
jgi:hypothetical protein